MPWDGTGFALANRVPWDGTPIAVANFMPFEGASGFCVRRRRSAVRTIPEHVPWDAIRGTRFATASHASGST